MITFINSLLRKQPGNSLTFLLSSMTVIGLSVAATTAALGPMSVKKDANNPAYSLADVADHHLNAFENYVRTHSGIIAKPDNYFPRNQAKDYNGDGLPAFQIFRESSSDFTSYSTNAASQGLGSALSYSEQILINGSQVTATSVIPYTVDAEGLDQGRFGIVKFAKAPYRNTIRVIVKVTAGDKSLVKSRLISLSPSVCDVTNAPAPDQTTAVPTFVLDPGVDNGDFTITKVTDAAIQLGSQRICFLPERNRPMSCDEGLTWGYNLGLIGSENDRIKDGQIRFVMYLTHKMPTASSPGGAATDPSFFQFKAIFIPDDPAIASYRIEPETGGQDRANMGEPTIPENFAYHVVRPDVNDPDGIYTVYVFWRIASAGANQGKLKYTWIKLKKISGASGPPQYKVLKEGFFNPSVVDIKTPNLASNPSIASWQWNNQNFTYDPKQRLLVGAGDFGNGNGGGPRVYASKITQFEPNILVTNVNCLGTPVGCSDQPNPYNPARYLYTGNSPTSYTYNSGTFAKPVVSSDGQFVVTPILATAATGGTRVVMTAWNTDPDIAGIRVNSANANSYSSPLPPNPSGITGTTSDAYYAFMADQVNNKSTLVTLADYRSSFSPTSYVPTMNDGRNVNTFSDVKIWYQNGKFYWLLRGSQYVYEWDPATWGKNREIISGIMGKFIGTSLYERLRNSNNANEDTAASNYTGMFQTVRKISTGGAVMIGGPWDSSTATPEIIVNSGDREAYIKDGTTVNRVSMKRGVYTKNFLTGVTGMAFDYNTRTLYFSRTNGLYAYNIPAEKEKTLFVGVTTLDFSAGAGDGAMVYSPYTQSIHYLNKPSVTVSQADPPKFFRYAPMCYAAGAGDNVASTMLNTTTP